MLGERFHKLCKYEGVSEKITDGMFDLHTHSLISDGTTTPSEIAIQAASIGLAGFALTDHDTTAGWAEARTEALRQGIEFLPGIELTTTHLGRSVHLLAYGPDPSHPELQSELTMLLTARFGRAQEMISRLRRDFTLDWEEVLRPPTEGEVLSVGRPHLADALVRAGYFSDRSEAFAHVLSPRSQYYVPTYAIDTTTAIELVLDAGGFPVVAHPAAFRMRSPLSEQTIEEFAEAGLKGIELGHPENREDWLGPLRDVTQRLNLVETGSSDYHGDGKPNILGEFTTPAVIVEQIRAQIATPR